MALFPQGFLDDLKAQSDIVSVIGEVVSLRKTGATFKGLCPFHEEKTPSFNVNGEKGFFKCFGCGAGGDVFTFVELHEKLGFPEVVRHLAARAGVQSPNRPMGLTTARQPPSGRPSSASTNRLRRSSVNNWARLAGLGPGKSSNRGASSPRP